jgi:taurine--2-oxoglutarate transaminase
LDREHVFHPWAAQTGLRPIPIAGGLGSRIWDFDGNTYLDFSSQHVNVNIGHQHPAMLAAIATQLHTLTTISPSHANLARGEAAERILSHAPESFTKVFFTNGGADANENAIRLARLHTGREKILSHYRSYHGNTGAAIAATGDWRRTPNEYSRGHIHFFGPYLYRSEFAATTPEEECERALHHLERVIQAEGFHTIAAILLETIPGTAGILIPPAGYLEGVRRISEQYGILLILDEVMAGFARAGQWFAFDAHTVTPDLITFAKGVNSGYVPIGGVIISADVADGFAHRVFPGGLTYSGHPLAAAAIVASIDTMQAEGIVDHAAEIGRDVLGPALRALENKHPQIGQVRGVGVFWALELVRDENRVPASGHLMAELKRECAARGLLPFFVENRIHVVPPAVITAEEAIEGVDILDDVLTSLETN